MSNEKKNRLLGMNPGSATHRLRKMILFDLLQQFDLDQCFQCDGRIERVADLSVEHIDPWQGADDPKAAFFDLENIAFSHSRCNVRAARSANAAKEQCPSGHPYTPENTIRNSSGSRQCRICFNAYRRRWRRNR